KLFKKGFDYKKYLKSQRIKHISLADRADLVVIAPATANTIANLANGIANDLLSTTVLASKADKIICPAMNVNMWENKITKQNISKLRKLNFHVIEPEHGRLACGVEGKGRLAGINKIEKFILGYFEKKNQFKGKKIMVTAGATVEEIDPVRVITNKSSGKMGIAIANAAFRRGADVTLVRGNTTVEPDYNYKDVQIKSASDMYKAVKDNINVDIVIHTAAVSDFTVDKKSGKISSKNKLNLELTPTTKILEKIKKLNKDVFLVGFKAEYDLSEERLIEMAYHKLKKSNADLIVANDVAKKGAGFETDTNKVVIVDADKKTIRTNTLSKNTIAGLILEEIKCRKQ
ncbi:bifunctional phosphopantothenoylcysteine decarboxylase/phosphopantothenate--cysteine ligase CoaBC, partial [Candidatus Woesearchaeota archaeon]|nr:bifunctional phosphopantothenoylcysteine decarboxylase/phosphopantothenate--cysteine ligase CoaBC [Candidatus Woesearchaeota archaeon]